MNDYLFTRKATQCYKDDEWADDGIGDGLGNGIGDGLDGGIILAVADNSCKYLTCMCS